MFILENVTGLLLYCTMFMRVPYALHKYVRVLRPYRGTRLIVVHFAKPTNN